VIFFFFPYDKLEADSLFQKRAADSPPLFQKSSLEPQHFAVPEQAPVRWSKTQLFFPFLVAIRPARAPPASCRCRNIAHRRLSPRQLSIGTRGPHSSLEKKVGVLPDKVIPRSFRSRPRISLPPWEVGMSSAFSLLPAGNVFSHGRTGRSPVAERQLSLPCKHPASRPFYKNLVSFPGRFLRDPFTVVPRSQLPPTQADLAAQR